MNINFEQYAQVSDLKEICKDVGVGLYLVGGAVRDLFLNKEISDFDFLVYDQIDKIVSEFSIISGKSFILFDKKIRVFRFAFDNYTVDISQIKPNNLEKDLRNRDFTINSIAIDMFTKDIIDLVDGRVDLQKRSIRATQEDIFEKDPLRLIRLFRIAALLKFDVEKNTLELARRSINFIHKTNSDRIVQELEKFFIINDTFSYLLLADRVGLIDAIFEDLSYENGCMQSESHLYDVKAHSLSVYNFVEWSIMRMRRVLGDDCFKSYYDYYRIHRKEIIIALKLAALFHDCGKPFVKQVSADEISFKNHEIYSVEIFKKYAQKYNFQKKVIQTTIFLILNHIEPAKLFLSWKNNTINDEHLYDFFEKFAINGIDLLIFALSDTLAKGKIRMINREVFIDFLKDMTCFYFDRYITFKKIPAILKPEELLKLGLKDNQIGITLNLIRKLTFLGRMKTKEDVISFAKSLIT